MKLLLDARPINPPKWWPRSGLAAAQVGVLVGGAGWVLGDGDLMTARQRQEARRMFTHRDASPVPGVRFSFKTRRP